jgi:hypothetical protein
MDSYMKMTGTWKENIASHKVELLKKIYMHDMFHPVQTALI